MSRLQSVDVLRTIAIISVIAIHTRPFELQASPIGQALDVATVINQTARFAVPFFFVLSGYFWGKKFEDEKGIYTPTVKMIKRVSVLFFAWSVIYLFPTNIVDALSSGMLGPIKLVYWKLKVVANGPLIALMEGTKPHLWFLSGLLCSLSISALLLRYKLDRLLIVLAIVLYMVGLAGKAYSDTPLGFHSAFNFRDGPFFALIFFVTGYFIQRRQASDAWFSIGCFLATFGACLHFAELAVLHQTWGTTMLQDYVVGTYFFGVGVALIALSNTKWLQSSRLATIGSQVLGIYVSHLMFVDILKPLDRRFSGDAIWDVFYVVAVFLLSYTLTKALSAHHFTKWLVV